MPRKNVSQFTQEEKNTYNKELLFVQEKMAEAPKGNIYPLKVVVNKRKKREFDPKILTNEDLKQSDQVFAEIFGVAEAFRRKNGDTDLMSDFYSEKDGRKPVMVKVTEILKENGIDTSNPQIVESYAKAYIIYGMTENKEKVMYQPGYFDQNGNYVTGDEKTSIRFNQGMYIYDLFPSINVGNIKGLSGLYCNFGDDLADFKEKDVPEVDIKIFDTIPKYEVVNPEKLKNINNINFVHNINNIGLEEGNNIDNIIKKEDDIKDFLGDDNFFEDDKNVNRSFSEIDQEFEDIDDDLGDQKNENNIQNNNDESLLKENYIHLDNSMVNPNNVSGFTEVDMGDEEPNNNLSELLDDDKKEEERPHYRGGYRDPNNTLIGEGLELENNENEIRFIENPLEEEIIPNVEVVDLQNVPANEQIDFLYETLHESQIEYGNKSISDFSYDVREKYNAAHSKDAGPNEKVTWAAYTLSLHMALKTALKNIHTNTPELFDYDKDAIGVREAYKLNTNLCAQALAEAQVDIFGALADDTINRAYLSENKANAMGADAAKNAMETSIARALYLARLEHEYKNVNGTEEEQKAWKQDILNELLSDDFDSKVEEYKNSDIFKRVSAKFDKYHELNSMAIKEKIKDALLEIAEEKYNEAYHYFADGAKGPEEIADVERIVSELKEIQTIGKACTDHTDFSHSPVFDYRYIRMSANLYGKFQDPVNDLIKEQAEQIRIQKDAEKAAKEAKDKYLKGYNELKAKLDNYSKQVAVLENEDQTAARLANAEKVLNEIQDKNSLEYQGQKMAVDTFRDMLDGIKETKKKMSLGEYFSEELRNDMKAMQEHHADVEGNLARLEYVAMENAKYHSKLRLDAAKKEADELPQKLREEDARYKTAIQNNDVQAISEIRKARRDRDNALKSQNTLLYAKPALDWNYKANDYITEPYAYYKSKMKESFQRYCNRSEVSEETKNKVESTIAVNDAIQNTYNVKTPLIKRPVRSALKISNFETQANLELTLGNVRIANNITKYENIPEFENPVSQADDEYDLYLKYAQELVDGHASKFYGSDEYDRIKNGITDVRTRMLEGAGNPDFDHQALMKDIRKNIIRMDHYIRRKLDEADSRDVEKKRSRKRREAVTTAREAMKLALESIETKYDVYGKQDYVISDVISEFDVIRELTGVGNASISAACAELRNGNESKAIDILLQFLNRNVDDYKNPNHGYNFRREEDNGVGVREPGDMAENVYKSVLLSTEKLINHYLSELQKNSPEKLPRARYYFERITRNGQSVKDRFDINVDDYENNLKINKPNSLDDYINNFSTIYKTLLNQKKYNNLEMRLYDPEHYNPRATLKKSENRLMLEAAFSTMFLKDLKSEGQPGDAFDFNKVETDRQKFISILKDSSIFDKLMEHTSEYMNLGIPTPPDMDIKTYNAEMAKLISTPAKFNKNLVAQSVMEVLTKEIKKVSLDILSKDFDGPYVQRQIAGIDTNLKIAKALGLSEEVERANKLLDSHYKAETMAETMKNIKNRVKTANVSKKSEITKGVNLGR